jgi:hypothetical protein
VASIKEPARLLNSRRLGNHPEMESAPDQPMYSNGLLADLVGFKTASNLFFVQVDRF